MGAKRRILIATIPGDLHALAVAEALQIKGAEPVVWYTSDFPASAVESVQMTSGSGLELAGIPTKCKGPFSIWNRRAIHELETEQLHPSDRSFAMLQCRRFRTALLAEVLSDRWAESGLCVNPYSSITLAENKMTQAFAAQRVGLDIPRSLFSNDNERISRFLKAEGGEVVYKPMRPLTWIRGEEELLNFTRTITEDDLVSDDLMRVTPGIFQEIVPKEFEIRATLLGRRAFVAKVNSQETTQGTLDWRRAYDELTMEPTEMPRSIHDRCLRLMEELGIYAGCFDFVVTPEGRWVFLEVNQGGQFLFVEEYTELRLVDAFAELLLQGTVDFTWEDNGDTLRMQDVMTAAVERAKVSLEEHVVSRPPSVVEEPAPGEAPKTLI